MKKITLFFASLVLCLGAWAQNVVTAINTEKYYTLECRSGAAHSTNRFIGDDGTVINGQSAKAAYLVFEAAESENGYYIKSVASNKYLNHDGTHISASAEKSTVWTLGVGGKDKVANVVTFTIGNDKYLNNVGSDCTDGTCENLKANYHLGGPASGNACSLWELCEYDNIVVTISTPEEFENGKLYTFVTSRGWMGATEGSSNAISTARTAVEPAASAENAYFQWTVYKSGDNYYLYNVGKKQFLGEQSTDKDAPVAMSDTPAKVTFKATTKSGYPLMFKTTDDANCVVNHSANHDDGLITWNGGWNDTKDDGSSHVITLVGDLDNSMLTTIKAAVDAYEADNTEAKEVLDATIAVADGKIASLGEGVGKYTYTGEGDYATLVAEFETYSDGITDKNNPTPAEVEAKTADLNALIAMVTINLPEAGKYYRIKAVAGWNDDAPYLGSANSTVKDGRAEFVAEADVNTIFLFQGGYLKNYATGFYLVSNSNFLGYNGEQAEGSVIAFHGASNGLVGAYNISFNAGGRWLYCHKNNFTDAGGRGTENGYCFNIEEVELPSEPGEGEGGEGNPETSIEEVSVEATPVIYDLTGRRVEKMEKGIYIVNGRKVVIK